MATNRDIYEQKERLRLKKESKHYKLMRRAFTLAFEPMIEAYNRSGFIDVDKMDLSYIEESLFNLYKDTGETFFESTYQDLIGMKSKELGAEQSLIESYGASILTWLETEAGEKIVSIVDTVKKGVVDIISQSLQEGLSIPKTSKLIQQRYSQFSRARSTAIARTETITASNQGSLNGAQATGLELRKFWIATPGPRTRETHRQAQRRYNRQTAIPLDQDFQVGEDNMASPGAGTIAEENVNCRCTIGYVVIRE